MITWKEQTDAITLANGAFFDWHVRIPNYMHLKFSHQTDTAKYTRLTDTQTQKQKLQTLNTTRVTHHWLIQMSIHWQLIKPENR